MALLNLQLLLWSLLGCTFSMHAVDWGNTVSGDFTDVDIRIVSSNVSLNGLVQVHAATKDVVVTLQQDSSLNSGSSDARLFLTADAGHKIDFILNHNLAFQGADRHDLMVVVRGGGQVNFELDGGRKVNFTSNHTSHGAARVFVLMDNNLTHATMQFNRSGFDLDTDVEVSVGSHASLGYLAATSVESGLANQIGFISFDAANTGDGLMILRLDDEASVVIAGHLVRNANTTFTLSDVDLKTPAGKNAILKVFNDQANDATAALRVINGNDKLPQLLINPFCDKDKEFTGVQPGFILGANGTLEVDDLSYVDYIGITSNVVPFEVEKKRDAFDCPEVTGCAKERNPSALIIDGNPDVNATAAQFNMQGSSAIYFRSGVDDNGDVNFDNFTVDPNKLTFGPGNFVLSVEGKLDVIGDPEGNNALQILSLDVSKTGGSVFVESCEDVFPKRTFATDDCDRLLRFNKAAFLINNRMNLCDATLMHTDESHRIFDHTLKERPDVNSEPAYVGGETFKHCRCEDRPAIALCNGEIKFHTSAAFTGLDIRVPNSDALPTPACENQSFITFYSNGFKIDKDGGRFVVLGTLDGSFAADGSTIVDRDAHIDIFQETPQEDESAQQLILRTGFNDDTITKEIGCDDISGQCTRQTLYLGNSSNISIGTNIGSCDNNFPLEFPLITKPELKINGDFIYFETRGGRVSAPETSGVTGEGGIFVDKNGKISLGECCRSSLAAMVVKSSDGVVDLPKNRTLFDLRVGVTDWQIDLRGNEEERTVEAKDVCLADYLLDWGNVIKDFDNFIPYEPKAIPNPRECAPVTDENITQLPIIKGQVNQLLVKRSRLGDKAHLRVSGGFVRSLVLETGFFSDEAPMGVIVLDNFGRVGLGSTSRNIGDFASDTVLGINGITLITDGNGVVILNENIEINNTCAILAGPNGGDDQKITFFSNQPREIRIKSSGILDLSSFDSANKIVEFSGNVILKLEPGARIILNGGTLLFSDNARMELEEVLDLDQLDDLTSVRVKLIGSGFVVMEDNASMIVPENTFFGVESDFTCNCGVTDIDWLLHDAAHITLGVGGDEGGAFQVGNVEQFSGTEAPLVAFKLTLDGSGTTLSFGRQAFLGLGAGVVNKTSPSSTNWRVACLHNLGAVSIDNKMGIITHNRIFEPLSLESALLAIGNASGSYTFNFNTIQALIQGGGNMVLVADCSKSVLVKDLPIALFASKDLLTDAINPAKPVNQTPAYLFNYLKAKDIKLMASPRSTIAKNQTGNLRLGFVCTNPLNPLNPIVRRQDIPSVQGIVSVGGIMGCGAVSPEPSLERGAVAVCDNGDCAIDPTEVFQIIGFSTCPNC